MLPSYGNDHPGGDDPVLGKHPRWFLLAMVVLPALLPVIIDKIGDVFLHHFKNKWELEHPSSFSKEKNDKKEE